jgi:wyosine [tRNA(Phe)-imidazoG37] synthetase (radical SAM superfamily)
MSTDSDIPLHQAHRLHGRHWRDNTYCYPVVSRRSGGLSIGINLNPDTACNFDCIYCQVDRTTPPAVRSVGPHSGPYKVDLDQLRSELDLLLGVACDGSLFTTSPFDAIGADQRRVCDIAFSGDGEPTTYPRFDEAVQIAAEARTARGLDQTKLILITDACYLMQPKVVAGLGVMDENNGEIWAKLDAGTEDYYQRVNRPSHPLSHVLANIRQTALVRPIVIQSMWMKVHGRPPPDEELHAFAGHLNDITAAGGRIKLVQVYTIARRTAEAYATALPKRELDRAAAIIRGTANLPLQAYYGTEG